MKILFASTNEGKLKEARQILDVEIEGTALEIPEIQSLNNVKVATEKAKAYFAQLNKPVLVEDVSLEFEGLKGLPGTYINDFSKALGNQGLINLLLNNSNRKARAITTLAYMTDGDTCSIFEGIVAGTISGEPKGENGFGWDPIFIPEGFEKTFAQMSDEEKNSVSMRKRALEKFRDHLLSK